MKYILALLLLCSSALAQFQGYGSSATGGSTVVHVSNASQLTSALSSGGKHIVFDAGGTYSGTFNIPANTFVDGFSAPSVVTFTGSGDCLHIWSSNVIVQGVRIRNCGGDDIQIANGASNLVIDHVETEAGGDGNIDVTVNSHDVTVSWSILANNSASGLQLVKYNAYHVSLHHNIYYNSFGNSRVPWCEGGNDAPQKGTTIDLGVVCDVRYNIVSKWLIGSLFESDGRTATYGNLVSNFYDGQDSDHARNNIAICPTLGTAYVAGNASVLNPRGTPFCNYSTPAAVTKTNDPRNHAEYPAPAISGVCPFDNTARVNEWLAVKAQAGVVSKFPDDSTTTAIRNGITTPSASLFTSSWNAQTGVCSQINPPKNLKAVIK